MQQGLVLIITGIIMTSTFLSIEIVTEIFAQEAEEDNSYSI